MPQMVYRSEIAATTRKSERNLGLIDGTWLVNVAIDKAGSKSEGDGEG